MNLKLYARLIQHKTLSHGIDMYCADKGKLGYIREKQQEYKSFMQRIYRRLSKQHGFDRQKFNAFVEQSMTF
jgi:hypothetical protein